MLMENYNISIAVGGVHLHYLRVLLATADRGRFMLSGSPSFQPGTCPDLGLFWIFSKKRSRPPASQSDPTLTWSALEGLEVGLSWLEDWILIIAAGEEGLWGGGDFLLPFENENDRSYDLLKMEYSNTRGEWFIIINVFTASSFWEKTAVSLIYSPNRYNTYAEDKIKMLQKKMFY